MASFSLGSAVDVVLGGADLLFPHHAYQGAMVEAASGVTPFARATVHVGEVRRDGRKMAKSTGNLVLVDDLLRRHPVAAVRLGLLNRPWEEPWDCEESVFERSAALLDSLYAAAEAPSRGGAGPEGVLTALRADLDVPRAVELALAEGGAAARQLLAVLKLRRP
jgi:cysteinyl-tRNA synthetase